MTTPISPIELNLDPSDYLQGLAQADVGTTNFATNVRTAALSMGPLQRALTGITPSRALLAGFGALATGAASAQAQLATMSGQARVTGANMGTLTAGMRQLARDMPVGNAGARQITQAITSMGVAAAGSESNVTRLAQVFTKLSGSTGEGAAGLAQGFIQLSRVMGTGTSAATMEKLGDSLTTISAKAGVSATGVLQFSKAIAPMAQASGIGMTKVLGISTAFSKLGEDGMGAASAFNKMLGDLNRSVREGSPGLTTYASIVGKTAGQFQDLFKNNPAEAITQVTEALGKSPNAPRQLESIGLDGVRTQRYIQELSASGGLRSAIADSANSYGDGATNKASKTAFEGLSDATQRAAANAGQLGDALGAPLLGPLTKFTNILGSLATPARSLAESKVGSTALTAAAWGAVLLGVIPKLLKGTGIMQLAGSGPVRSLFAGAAVQRAGTAEAALARGGLMSTIGGQQLTRIAAGESLGMGMMGRVNAGSITTGAGLGRLLGWGGPGGNGPGMLATARGAGFMAPSMLMNMYSEQARLARTPVAEREFRSTNRSPMTAMGRMSADYAKNIAGIQSNMVLSDAGRAAATQAARSELRTSMQGLTKLQALTGLGASTLSAGGNALASTGKIAGKGLGIAAGALSPLGGVAGAALIGGGWLYSSAMSDRKKENARVEQGVGGTSFIDDYRIAMGKATSATSTFAGKLADTAAAMSKTAKTFGDATDVSAGDISSAAGVKGKPIAHYTGNKKAVSAQLSRQVAGGMTPDELQRAGYDLINQYGANDARDILAGVNTSGNGNYTNEVATQVRGLAGIHQGKYRATRSAFGLGDNLTGPQKDAVTSLSQDVFTRHASLTASGGQGFANAETRKTMDAAVRAALEGGNTDLAKNLIKNFQKQFVGETKNLDMTQVKKHGFTATEAQLATGKAYTDANGETFVPDGKSRRIGKKFTDLLGGSDNATAGTPELSFAQKVLGANPMMSAIFSGQGPAGRGLGAQLAGQRLFGPDGNPESSSAQLDFVHAFMASGRAAGQSLDTLAKQALESGVALTDGTDEGKAAFMAFSAAAQQISANIRGLRPGQQLGAQARLAFNQASIRPTDPTSQALQQQGVQNLQQAYQQTVSFAQQRLQAQKDYQTASMRSAQDFATQKQRMEDSFALQQARGEADYNKSRLRSQKAFALQMAREAEDAAKSMYDPYQRIQAKGVWDMNNLQGNLAEQNKAMADQVKNLALARKAGLKDSTITLLGLNDPNNAQQLAQSIGQLTSDPAVVKALNDAATTRQNLAAQLTQDPSNTAYTRQNQDFKTSMNQMANDYQTTVNRANQDFSIATTQMNTDYKKMVDRAHQDLVNGDQVMTTDLAKLTSALSKAVNGQMVDFKNLTQNGLDDWVTLLRTFATGDYLDVLSQFDLTITAGGKPVVPVVPIAHTSANDSDTNPRTAVPAPPVTTSQAHNMATGSRASVVYHTVTIDQSTPINGEVTVKAEDPNTLGRRLAADSRRRRATAPAVTRG